MPIDPNDFRTGGALQGAVAASLLRQRDAAAELAPGEHVGIFRVLRELGRGGMAIVYLAERDDGEYQQQVALKWMLQAQPDASSAALFRRERQALADLRHPHIARLLDGGRTDDGRPWLAMELIDGAPLDRHCVEHALPLALRLALFRQVCAAVAFAHARGVIHRDIKPSNVLVDADGSARLLDFGIAQLLGQDDALAARAYTPGFASPEQVRGETLTVASDVYQLGRLLAALLSADAREHATMLQPRTHAAATEPHAAAPLPAAIDADLGAIVLKATADEPARRYATADALSADIDARLQRRPVAARRRSARYLATRFAQRHPLGLGAGLLALLLAIGGTAYFTARLRGERDVSASEAARAESVSSFLVDLFRDSDPTRSIDATLTARELVQRGVDRLLADRSLPPQTRNELHATLADIQISLGDTAQATALLQRLERGSVTEQRFEELSGRLASKRGEARTAVEHLGRALRLAPSPRLELLLARAESDAGDSEGARRRLDALIARLPQLSPALQSSALLNAGVLRWRNAQPAEALALYRRALELREGGGRRISETAVRINSALALIDLARLDEALHEMDLAEASLADAPNKSLSHLLLQQRGIVHFRRDEFEQARRVWTEMRDRTAGGVNPGSHASALHNLATTYESDGDAASGLALFLEAATARDALGDRPGALSSRINAAFKLSDLALPAEAEALARRCAEDAAAIARPDLHLRAVMAQAKAERVRAAPTVFATLEQALALAAGQQNLLKRLELHEARARAALRPEHTAQLQAAARDFIVDARDSNEAGVQRRAEEMQALLAPDPEAALERLLQQPGHESLATLLVEFGLARDRLAFARRHAARLTPRPNAVYWTLVEQLARRDGRRAEAATALSEMDRLRQRGHAILAGAVARPDPTATPGAR